MTTAKKSASSSKTTDAISLLEDDHKRVRKMFKDFEKMKEDGDASEKEALAAQICDELTLHTEVEEHIFYPAAREAIEDDDMLNEAEVEHGSAKDLIAQIESGDASDPMWAARVTVLGEYIEHHVTEEEKELFPKVRKAKLDLEALGEEIASMKVERQGEADGETMPKAAQGKRKTAVKASSTRQ
jgi:hemerythrin-like domain-containing protein